jgi:ABC-type dipeptide/oligopeptide/nickel transport system permease component
MKLWRYLRRRMIFIIPQILGVTLITFFIVRMIPGDPARIIAGSLVNEAGVELIRERMGLTKPLPVQLLYYIRNIFQGDLGRSWVTGNPVLEDILLRLPATLELIILALIVSLAIMVPLAIRATFSKGGFLNRFANKVLTLYGMAAGAFPDFWLALILIFVFYVVLGWVPSPIGAFDIAVVPPQRLTGFYIVDSLLTGNWDALKSVCSHLILPVFVLAFVYGGGILKVAMVSANEVRKSDYINYAEICGLPEKDIQRYISKASYPSVATFTAVIFGFLIGGAVLVESVFSWGGFGQYAVQSVVNSDFAAIQGVVLFSAILNLVIYIFVDIIYYMVDPRIKNLG